ncbi:MAG: hypothetical protein Q9171_007466 [Xanthocarpia ochracea]
MGLLKSPMILMALVGLGMVFGMPYLLENSRSLFHRGYLSLLLPFKFISGSRTFKWDEMANVWLVIVDPEMKKEFEEQQKSSVVGNVAGGGNPLSSFDMAGWMAGQTSGRGVTATARENEDERGAGGGGGQGQVEKETLTAEKKASTPQKPAPSVLAPRSSVAPPTKREQQLLTAQRQCEQAERAAREARVYLKGLAGRRSLLLHGDPRDQQRLDRSIDNASKDIKTQDDLVPAARGRAATMEKSVREAKAKAQQRIEPQGHHQLDEQPSSTRLRRVKERAQENCTQHRTLFGMDGNYHTIMG